MSFRVANGSYPSASRTQGQKLYSGRATLANGADPTVNAGAGFKLVRANEGVYTLTLDETLDAVTFQHASLDAQTDLQYCQIELDSLGDDDEGAVFTIRTGTVSVENARTADDVATGVLSFLIVGTGPGVQYTGQG